MRELQKSRQTACTHQCGTGCGIYATRPQSCRDFECLWLSGHINSRDAYRPDVLGVIFSVGGQTGPVGSFLEAHEVRPGALTEQKVRYLLDKLSRDHLIALKYHDNRSAFIGPPGRLQRVQRVLAQHALVV